MNVLNSGSLVLQPVSLNPDRSTVKLVVYLKEMQNINQRPLWKLCLYTVRFMVLHTANKKWVVKRLLALLALPLSSSFPLLFT